MINEISLITFLVSSVAASANFSPNAIGDNINATFADAPWMVSLQMYEDDFAYCGATLINVTQDDSSQDDKACHGWVVTSASCLDGVPNIIATLGNIHLGKTEETEIKLDILDTERNEDNSTNKKYSNDIALLEVGFTIPDNEHYKDVNCPKIPFLHFMPEHVINETFFVTMNASIFGWGLLEDNGPLQKELYSTRLPLHTDQQCANQLGHDSYDQKTMLCAGGPTYTPNSYDTGGPLTCSYEVEEGNQKSRHQYLCGVASIGPLQGNSRLPAIFMDVSDDFFADWINGIITGQEEVDAKE